MEESTGNGRSWSANMMTLYTHTIQKALQNKYNWKLNKHRANTHSNTRSNTKQIQHDTLSFMTWFAQVCGTRVLLCNGSRTISQPLEEIRDRWSTIVIIITIVISSLLSFQMSSLILLNLNILQVTLAGESAGSFSSFYHLSSPSRLPQCLTIITISLWPQQSGNSWHVEISHRGYDKKRFDLLCCIHLYFELDLRYVMSMLRHVISSSYCVICMYIGILSIGKLKIGSK